MNSATNNDCPWESREYGAEEQYAKAAIDQDQLSKEVDESLELQMISIRLHKGLIDDFKILAELHGLGYQPLMRIALQRFAEGEKKGFIKELAEQAASKKKGKKPSTKPRPLLDAA